MCGIAGVLEFSEQGQAWRALTPVMEAIAHRGRDDSGMVFGSGSGADNVTAGLRGRISLGHRRLAIIDLSPHGHQPMCAEDGRAWVVYNGELYNFKDLRTRLCGLGHRFVSETDTEVVLKAYLEWGLDCLPMFNGIFSLAIWDNKRRQLHLARDHVGVKPLYIFRNADHLAFCSESKALSPFHHNMIDEKARGAYFLGMYVPGRWSIFKNVEKLEPGHVLTVDHSGSTRNLPFWSTDQLHLDRHESYDIEAIAHQLRRSVHQQMVSDVPVGIFLSGGADSSAVAMMTGDKIDSFSVGYETPGYDELPFAQQVANAYTGRHFEMRLKPEEVLGALDEALACLTEPIADSALVPNFMLSRVAADHGIKVILNGTGGDEVFGGYVRYMDYGWHRYLFNHSNRKLRKFLGQILHHFRPDLGYRIHQSGLDMFLCTGGLPEFAMELAGSHQEFSTLLEKLIYQCFPTTPQVERGYQAMSFDLGIYLPDQLLLLLDQTTMAATLEGRVPLLDPELITAAYKLPFNAHVHEQELKHTFKKILSSYMPPGFFDRKKQGFGGPVISWVRHHHAKLMECVTDPSWQQGGVGLLPFGERPRYRRDNLDQTSANEIFRYYCYGRWLSSIKT